MVYVVHYNVTQYSNDASLDKLKEEVKTVFGTTKALFIPTNADTRIEVYHTDVQ
jgi:hypothetical protein